MTICYYCEKDRNNGDYLSITEDDDLHYFCEWYCYMAFLKIPCRL